MSRIKVLHVVPSLNIGGVEVGLLRSQSELEERLAFQVFSVKGPGRLNLPSLNWLRIFKLLFRKEHRPQVVVTSLWLGHLVGFLLAVFYGARWVPFFHAARSEGVLRDTILRGAARLSCFAFFDSPATFRYYEMDGKARTQIIPYRFLPPGQDVQEASSRAFTCIFVGRLSPEKRLDLLIEFLSRLRRLMPDIQPLVVLSGVPKALEEFGTLLEANEVTAVVRANVPPLEVVDLLGQSVLYLSFSDYEGFGMATVDAMSCGCIPVVRPVGEMASYVDENCGVLVTDVTVEGIKAAAERSVALLKDTDMLRVFSERARDSVSRYRLYSESYVEGVRRALGQT